MNPSQPSYLLFTESLAHPSGGRMWRFLLMRMGTEESVSACDIEPAATSSRAELLAVVRGLEAIDEPGTVKLVTGSGSISRGITRGLKQWRMQGWHWERFGRRVPVRDCDLWQRVDRALDFHTVDCHAWGEPSTNQNHASPMVAQETGAQETSAAPAARQVPVVHRPDRRRRSRRQRLAAATKQTVGALREGVGTLLPARLAAAS